MRILHVLVTEDGDSLRAGSLSTSVEECNELRRRGHDVRMLIGWRGREPVPLHIGGSPVHTVELHRGFAVRKDVRAALHQLHGGAAGPTVDIAHLHGLRSPFLPAMARHLRSEGIPYVVQLGPAPALEPTGRWDRIARRLGATPMIEGAERVFVLDTDEVALGHLTRDTANIQVMPLRRGVKARAWPPGTSPPGDAPTGRRNVLFMGGLHPGSGVMAFARAAAHLIERGVDADFCVVGPDEGARAELLVFIGSRPHLADRLRYEGRRGYDQAIERLRAADIYVAPSLWDACPVGLPEALAYGLPTVYVGHERSGLSARLAAQGAILQVAQNPTTLGDALNRLLATPSAARRLSDNGLLAAGTTLAITPVVDTLLTAYGAPQETARLRRGQANRNTTSARAHLP
jgi:glycosyltransferase involved in cell wall biosynthesis